MELTAEQFAGFHIYLFRFFIFTMCNHIGLNHHVYDGLDHVITSWFCLHVLNPVLKCTEQNRYQEKRQTHIRPIERLAQ